MSASKVIRYKQYSDYYASMHFDTGFTHFIDPTGNLQWQLRYNKDVGDGIKLCAASVIDSFNYLLSANITNKQAEDRLRAIRNELKSQGKQVKLGG